MLEEYFQSYRASALRDLLPEFSEEASGIPVFASNTSLFQFLQQITRSIKDAVSNNDRDLFLNLLREHQKASIEVQRSVVAKYDSPLKHGWKSFKFSDVELRYNKFTISPRIKSTSITTLPVVYAHEMSVITKDNAEKVLQIKSMNPCLVHFLPNGEISSIDIKNVNNGIVRDWTAELKLENK